MVVFFYNRITDAKNDFFILLSVVGVGIHAPPHATAAVQPAHQALAAQAAPPPVQAAAMPPPQTTPQHQQLYMKHQQASAFLSPQSNQQVDMETFWNQFCFCTFQKEINTGKSLRMQRMEWRHFKMIKHLQSHL